MGQSIAALMYGVKRSEMPDGLRDAGDDWLWYGKLEDEPRDAYEGDCIGFAVAVSGGGDDDEGDLGETCFLAEVAGVHSERIVAAKEKWKAFAAWFKKNCSGHLPKPELLLTRDERA